MDRVFGTHRQLEDAYFLLEIRRASHSLNRSHRVCIGTLGMTSTVHHTVTYAAEIQGLSDLEPTFGDSPRSDLPGRDILG